MTIYRLEQKLKKNTSIRQDLKNLVGDSNHEVYIGQYLVTIFLGKGSFGQVYKGIHSETKKPVAIKFVDIEQMWRKNNSEEIREKLKKYIITEETLMKKCHSAFVVKLYETLQNDKCKIFIMEYCRGGGLDSMISQRKAIEQEDAIQIIRQVMLGLTELHRNNIIHRDLKPANILIHDGIFKIADLGFSTEIEYEQQVTERTVCGSRNTMAPQVKNNEPYGLKADIWSLGMIYFMMVYADPSTPTQNKHLVAWDIIKDKQNFIFRTILKEKLTEESSNFLKRSLEPDPEKRMDWQQAIQHKMFMNRFDRLPSVYNHPYMSQVKHEKKLIMQSKQFELFKQQLANSSHEKDIPEIIDFDELNDQYLECRKAQFILLEMIIPLQKKQLLDFTNRNHVQLMFLLISRCRENLIFAKKIVGEAYNEEIKVHFYEKIQALQGKIKSKYNEVSDRLKNIEDKFTSIISDKLSKIVSNNNYKVKQKFLMQFQRKDFTKQQQIKHTIERYIVEIINELEGNEKDEERMRKLFKAYRQLNYLKVEEIKNQRINDVIDTIITKDY